MANDRPPNGVNGDKAPEDDLRLQVGPEDVITDIDPHLPVEFLKKARAMSGKPPAKRTPREDLVKTHNEHVNRQKGRPRATNLVKKPILALAYPASHKSMYDLEKVGSGRSRATSDASAPQLSGPLYLTEAHSAIDPSHGPPRRDSPRGQGPHPQGHHLPLPGRGDRCHRRGRVGQCRQARHLQPERPLHPVHHPRGLGSRRQGALLQVQRRE